MAQGKKWASGILAAALAVSMTLSAAGSALAAPPDKAAANPAAAAVQPGPGTISSEQAVARARAAFTIPDKLTEFHANYSEYQGPVSRKVWSLYWTEPQKAGNYEPRESMSFEVDAVSGEVRNMGLYRVLPDGTNTPAIKLSREQAQPRAEEVLKRLQPERFPQMKLLPQQPTDAPYPGSLNGPVLYTFFWVRQVNGLPVANEGLMQGATISVDASDGAVTSYNFDWNDAIQYPDPQGGISDDKALKIWSEKLGLELQYQLVYDVLGASKPKVQLVYAWRLPFGSLAINAQTGKLTDQWGREVTSPLFGEELKWPQVTPDPAVKGPVDRNQAEAIAKSMLNLDSSWEMTGASYSENRPNGQEPSWNFNFIRKVGDSQESASATIGATTGRVQAFWRGLPWKPGDENKEPTITRDQALATALTFIATHLPYEVGRIRLAPSYDPSVSSPQPVPGYSFQFERLVNGVPMPASTLSVGVDGRMGIITNLYGSEPVTEGELPDKAQAISMDAAVEAFASKVGLEKAYRVLRKPVSEEDRKAGIWREEFQENAEAVYQIPMGYRGLQLGAVSGRLTDNQGRDVEMLLQPPKDVAGHWALSDILVVSARGLLPVNDKGEFQPNKPLTRAEAARLVVLAFGRGEVRPMKARFADVALGAPMGGFIESAAQAGWLDVTDGSFRPGEAITRQDFAAMLIRALGYSKVAKMDVQIPTAYTDHASISPELRNAVALAAGLKIFSQGGRFRPNDPLTRAEAAVTIMRVGTAR
ncbi:MAG: S-layer homology domain-containing protein [Bacillota bacterium]